MSKKVHKVFTFEKDDKSRMAVSYKMINGLYRTRFFKENKKIAVFEKDFNKWKDAIKTCEEWIK